MSVDQEFKALISRLTELEKLGKEVAILERQLSRRKKERNELALALTDTGILSIRRVAKHAGLSNVRLSKLKKERDNGN